MKTLKSWKVFEIFLVKSTSECYFWLANKDSTEYFLKFSLKVFRISFRPKKSLLGHFWWKLENLEKFSKFFGQKYIRMLFLTWNKVSTDSKEYFLKFSLKVFRISFRPKKSLLGHFWFKLKNLEKFLKFFGQKYIRILFLTCKQSFNWF